MIWDSVCRFSGNVLSLLMLAGLLITRTCSAEECQKQNACKCVTDSGATVDLSKLVEHLPAGPTFNMSASNPLDTAKYSYRPCDPVYSVGGSPGVTNTCQDVLACQHTTDGQYQCLADNQNVEFSGDPAANTLLVKYVCVKESVTRTLYVKVVCDTSNTLEVYGEQQESKGHYNFTLHTPEACVTTHHGITTGSILLIVFFISVLLYLVLGVLFLRYARGARGVEQIPNYEFWKDFPNLVKDGVVFTVGGCKSDQTYEKI